MAPVPGLSTKGMVLECLGDKTHEDFTVGPGRPAGKLHAIREGLVQHINWTPPHMEVMKLGLRPSSLEE